MFNFYLILIKTFFDWNIHWYFIGEAVHLANQLCQYGYLFPVPDCKSLTVKDDSSLYRFQVSNIIAFIA